MTHFFTKFKVVNILIILTIICQRLQSQEVSTTITNLDPLDVYVMEFKPEIKIATIKYNSCLSGIKTKMILYKIKVSRIIHKADTLTYSNIDLLNLKYALLSEDSIQEQRVGCFYNSESKEFLLLNKIIVLPQYDKVVFKQHAFLYGLMTCKKKNKVIKTIRSFEKN